MIIRMLTEAEALKLIKSKIPQTKLPASMYDDVNSVDISENISENISEDIDPGADFDLALGDEEIAKLMNSRRNLGDDHFASEYKRIKELPENIGRDINITFTPYGTPIIVDREKAEKKLLGRGASVGSRKINNIDDDNDNSFRIKEPRQQTEHLLYNNSKPDDPMYEIQEQIEKHYRYIAPNLYKYIKMLEAAVFK